MDFAALAAYFIFEVHRLVRKMPFFMSYSQKMNFEDPFVSDSGD